MLNNITYYLILGKPLIMYLGIVTLLSIIATTAIGAKKMPIKLHTRMAILSLVLAFIHGLLGVLAYF